jgi:purine-cytosine permease-like protein
MALPMCPWALVSGATVFISVMGGYATFLAPMTGVMLSDYFLIRKRNMKLSALVSRDVLSPRERETDSAVRVQFQFILLLLERGQLASSNSLDCWRGPAVPWLSPVGLDGPHSRQCEQTVFHVLAS